MVYCLLYILIITNINSLLIEPTISNQSGDFYIISQSNWITFASHSINCNAFNCFIICDSKNGCNHTTISSINSVNLFIFCAEISSCFSIQILDSATNSTSIQCLAHKACSYGTINLQQTSHYILINCSSSNTQYACYQNSYFLPLTNNSDIIFNCIGFGCYYFGDMYLIHDERIQDNDIAIFYIHPCNECTTDCIYNYTIYCNNSYDLYINEGCESTDCGCNQIQHKWNHDMQQCALSVTEPKVFNIWISIIISTFILCVCISFCVLCVLQHSEFTISLYSNKKKRKRNKTHINEMKYKRISREKSDGDNARVDVLEDNDNNEITLRLPKSIFPLLADEKSKGNMLRSYSMDEISRNCTRKSCWIVVNNCVLDVTSFLQYHPGNGMSIIKYAGTDCDEHFAFHSPAAKRLFFKFVIGKVAETKKVKRKFSCDTCL